jgi:hypothetical protein
MVTSGQPIPADPAAWGRPVPVLSGKPGEHPVGGTSTAMGGTMSTAMGGAR